MVTESGRVKAVNAEFLKALFPILINCDTALNVTVVNDDVSSNKDSPSVVIILGIVIEVKPVFLNVLEAMVVTPVPNVIDVKTAF